MGNTLGSFKDRDVAVVGLGKSNQALARYLLREGARVTCCDRKTSSELGVAYEELTSQGVSWNLGEDYLRSLPVFPVVFLTPGMKKNLPEIAEARRSGALITNEIALFLDRCAARVCGVTGSAGKTTTSTLMGLMLRKSLPATEVYVGGNIGAVLIENVDQIPAGALVVLELSSFQLELVGRSPEISAVLNIRPNHLDIHDSYDDYVDAKKNIFRTQSERGFCILNLDDPVTRDMAAECRGETAFFTLDPAAARREIAAGHPVAWLKGGELLLSAPHKSHISLDSDVVRLAGAEEFLVPGKHNIANALTAALGSLALGGSVAGTGRAIRAFKGVEHRIEFVREHRGVRYYNDSIATSPDRTEALLGAVSGPLTLILGGYDKGIPFGDLADRVVVRGCSVITLGNTAPAIEEALQDAWKRRQAAGHGSAAAALDVTRVSSLEQAVQIAAARSAPGASVALAPACASYDMFSNFEERGRAFKELVMRLG